MKICSYFIFSHFIIFLVSHECKVLSHLEIILFKKNIFFFFFSIEGTFQIILLKILFVYRCIFFNLILQVLTILNS